MMVRRGIIWVLLVLVVAVGTVHSQEEFLVSIEFDPNPEMTTTSTTTTVASISTTTTLASSSTTRSTSRMPTTMEESLEKSLEESLEVLPDSLETPNETDFVESHLNNLVPRRNRTQGIGLFPVVFNLATRATITSNATCGEKGPENFCKLVQHVLRRPTKHIQCATCDAYSLDPLDRHPIQQAIDGSNRWWQSPSISRGILFHTVTITLDLGQVYQVAYVIVKAANSPRPGNWILERSLDGVDYKPWQYYALSDSECWNMYGMAPTIGVPRFTGDDEVLCSSAYSRLDPLENGEIHTSLVNGRPGVDGPSEELQEFTSARFIRLRLQRIRTLNADLMTFMSNDPLDLDPSVTNRYFYSIKDISVGGQCICYGHARQCPVDELTGELHCECEKNTCGRSCERCCPLFNQQPWRQGTYTEGGGCEECVCFGHASSCVYNQTIADRRLSLTIYAEYDGGGVCVDCQHNTMGVNCELCADGFYRPQGIDHRSPDACRPCDCDTHGATGHCVKDDSHVMEGFCAGDCTCNEGFAGPKCSECAPGWHGYPACEQCACDPAGSLNVDTCEGDCSCKENVCGPFCDECLPGFYNLQTSNPLGCTQCFCFGVADVCESLPWGHTQISTLSNWTLTDLAGSRLVASPREDGHLLAESDVASPVDHVQYWSAPWQYTGNKLLSYGGQLRYTFHYWLKENTTEEDRENDYLGNSDVILEGSGMKLGHSGRYYRETMDNIISINMTERGWRHLDGSSSHTGTLVPREEFLTVLGRVDRVLLRATYHLKQTSARLKAVHLDEAAEDGPELGTAAVELCHCPEGYAGTSCEQCAEGFRRVDNQLQGGQCVPCNCYGHSQHCDHYTGHCLNCADNTFGQNCEQCAPGYRGDATQGTSDDCKRCACPLEIETNNFARSCGVDREVSDMEFVCIDCQVGYEGSFCERCTDGYFGNPLVPGNYCQPCDCHGNASPDASATCDGVTGECVKCLHHTVGYHCERCMPGYYGSAVNGDCSPCECDVYGAVGAECDGTSGQCTCRDRFEGRDCGHCMDGYGNTASGCVPCNCSEVGSLSTTCDTFSGQCTCKPGVGGTHCDTCRKGFYRLTDSGCTGCGCYQLGSLSSDCDQVTGNCVCKEHVSGDLCDKCEVGYWGIDIGDGCRACDCDPLGSEFSQCDSISGQCQCKHGIGGRRCDECRLGYYGLSGSGCKECAVCAAPGQVCDRVTGECVCPMNTEGALCERCTPNTWGHDEFLGCKPCECNGTGAADGQCDVNTGQCQCREGFASIKCDSCRFGHFGFPACKPCHCDVAGTQFQACDANGHCQCDEDGHCPCKENTSHKKCRYCRHGAFSLEVLNPLGCTSCFCFGRSDTCVQAAYIWVKVNFPPRHVTRETNSTLVIRPDARGIMVIPSGVTSINVEEFYRPLALYWALPKAALGDRTLSYNGRLRFTVEYDIGPHQVADPDSFVLLHLIGAFKLHLQYMIDTAPTDRGFYEVLLREDLWQDNDGRPVTRENLMVALQNVQSLLVFAAPHSHITHTRLEGFSLDDAVPTNGTTTTAIGVEKCICPEEYHGMSCQNPGVGFFRERPNDFIISENIIDVVGESVLCRCHGHSALCEPETGRCLDCVHSTLGDHCQLCAPGYYGNATYGTAYDCQRCACPLFTPDNNFSPTCYALSDDDYVCDACGVGYTGVHCERCAPGYYGAPTTPDDECRSCDCNPDGSLSANCDPVTGQCSCLLGIRGRSCNKCEDRYALVDGDCRSCDVGCPAALMVSVDELEYMTTNYNESVIALWPYKYLAAQEDEVEQLRLKLKEADITALREAIREVQITQTLADKVDAKTGSVERAQAALTETEDTLQAANRVSDDIVLSHDTLTADISELTEMVTARLKDQTVNSEILIAEAEQILEEMLTARLGEGSIEDLQLDTDKELGEAEFQYSRMQQLALRVTNVSGVHDRAHESYRRLEDMKLNARNVANNTAKSTTLRTSNKDKFYNTTLLHTSVKEGGGKTRKANMRGAELNEMASHLLWNVSTENYKYLACLGKPEVVPDFHKADYLEKACVAARQYVGEHLNPTEEKAGLLEQSIPRVKPILQDAHNHAYDLDDQATSLEEQFSLTRESAADPLRAAKVYEDIVEAVEEAKDRVQEASESADNATIQMDTQEDGPLPEQAQESIEASRQLSSNASRLVHSLGEQLKAAQRQITATAYETHRMEDELIHLNSQVSNISTGITRTASVLKYRAELAMERALEVETRARDKQRMMNTEMMPKVQWLEEALEENDVPRVNASLQAARTNIHKLVNMSAMLTERLMVLESINTNVTLGIQQLRESIKLAREQANNIKVSLQTEGDCVRRYAPPIQPSTTNTIVLHFKTDNVEDNMLLLFVGKQDSTDFMLVELVESTIWFSWDMGAGKHTIIHPLQVEPASNKVEEEDKWYKVKVERISNTAKLSVRVLSSPIPGDPDIVMGMSEPSYTQLNLGSDADLFIGGAPAEYQLPEGIVTRNFVGCVGEVYLDGRQVGLYNFRHLEKEGTCDGCHVVPEEGDTGEGFQFDGSGFVEMPPLRGHNPGSLVVSTSFKTFWEEAQLFFSINQDTGDFISLELEGGHVVLRYDTGSFVSRGRRSAVSWSTLTTKEKYNTNDWVNASATFSQRNGVVLLRVNSEWVNGTISANSDGTLDLEGSKLYFGGVHPDIDPADYGLSTTKFLGCMRNVRAASQGTYTQNLLSGSYVGVSQGCKSKIARTTGLHGDGWVALPGKSLTEDGDASFSFRSQQANTLLLLVQGANSEHFYSFSLANGELAAWFSDGTGTVRITSDIKYNDGLLHSVSVVRDDRQIKVSVDDELVGSSQLPTSSSIIGMASQAVMYLGGVPEHVDITNMAASSQPLLGCLSNLIINKEVQALDEPTDFHRADIGRCPVALLFPDLEGVTGVITSSTLIPSFTITVTLPDSQSPTSELVSSDAVTTTAAPIPSTTTEPLSACAVEGRHPYYEDAVAFGDIINSHAEIVVRRREVNKDGEPDEFDVDLSPTPTHAPIGLTSFNITLDLKTYYKLGLVFYVTNEAQTEYIAVQLAEGKVLVSYDDHGVTRTIQSPGLVDDGVWHKVVVTKNRKSITLKIDDDPGMMGRITRRVDVIAPLYVGGIPRVYQIREGLIAESFKGCMRGFYLNGKYVDIINSKAIMGVRPCFSMVEEGVHFDGFGYAIYSEEYEIQSKFSMKFDFRTTRWNGVIMSISHPSGEPALALELRNGQLTFRAVNSYGSFAAVSQECRFCLCDNRWHHVELSYLRNVVTLRVDAGRLEAGVSGGGEEMLNTFHELFLGGFPVYVIPQGATTTNEFFQGCVKNLVVNGAVAHWHSMYRLQDVHISACPIIDT